MKYVKTPQEVRESNSWYINSLFRKIYESNKKVFIYRGGRGGGKTIGIADTIIRMCLAKGGSGNKVYVGRTLKTISDVSMRDLFNSRLEALKNFLIRKGKMRGEQSFYNIKSKMIDFTPIKNKSVIYFTGFNDEVVDNLKSNEMSIVWVDEAHNLTKNTIDKLIPSVRMQGFNNKLIFSYNPQFVNDDITKMSELYKDSWENITVNYYDNIFFNENTSLVRDLENDKELLEKGEMSELFFKNKWEGTPMVTDENLFIEQENIVKNLEYKSETYKLFDKVMGVDVARSGNDYSVILIRQGNKIIDIRKFKNQDGESLASKVNDFKNIYDVKYIFIDSVGVGASPCDFLRIKFKLPFFEINNGERAKDSNKYYNRRAECYGRIKDELKGGFDFGEGYDVNYKDELLKQLSFVPFEITSNMNIKLRRKEDIKEKLGCSPDIADALALSYSELINNFNDVIGGDNKTMDIPITFNF